MKYWDIIRPNCFYCSNQARFRFKWWNGEEIGLCYPHKLALNYDISTPIKGKE
jgi:hypothetical protein